MLFNIVYTMDTVFTVKMALFMQLRYTSKMLAYMKVNVIKYHKTLSYLSVNKCNSLQDLINMAFF